MRRCINFPFARVVGVMPLKVGSSLSWGSILCCISGTVDRHVRPNSGRSTINTVAAQVYPFLGVYTPKRGEVVRVGAHIVRHKRYFGLTYSGKFWSLCSKYGGHNAQISPFGEVLAPLWGDAVPFGGRHCVRLCVNLGQMQCPAYANFPFSGGLCPQKWGSGPSWVHIVRRKWVDMFR